MTERTSPHLALALAVTVVCLSSIACAPIVGQAEQAAVAEAGTTEQADTLDAQYLGLSSGPLCAAVLVDLPEDLLLRAGELSVSRAELQEEIDRRAGGANEQLRDHPFFVLENMAIIALLDQEAAQWAAEAGGDHQQEAPLDSYLQSIADEVTVGEEEARAYYDANRAMFAGATYEQVAERLQAYLLGEKQQSAVNEHIDSLSERHQVKLDAAFVAEAAETELANPVAEARRSGRPSLVDFGSEGCGPCDMMAPVLEELEAELADRCNVLLVQVAESPILAARYGVRSIPVQIFFDADGQEVYRHLGFLAKDDIMSKLQEMGVE